MTTEEQIVQVKARVFDLITQQAQLQQQNNQIEQAKTQLIGQIVELQNQLSSGTAPAAQTEHVIAGSDS